MRKGRRAPRASRDLATDGVAPRIGLGRAHLRLGRYEEAAASFEAAIAADSTAAAAFNWLGVAHTKLGQYEPAVQALRRAIHLDMLYPQAYYNLSQTYQKQGKAKESDAALRAFNRIDAYSGDILRWKTISTATRTMRWRSLNWAGSMRG